ncbi:hypothetical protein K438DRAFT_1748148 [Mycena galopus ATCC 62051]|nr:hypothetical protein K438DRAFT_1748148 [Mycena galopus ATCC 62051]
MVWLVVSAGYQELSEKLEDIEELLGSLNRDIEEGPGDKFIVAIMVEGTEENCCRQPAPNKTCLQTNPGQDNIRFHLAGSYEDTYSGSTGSGQLLSQRWEAVKWSSYEISMAAGSDGEYLQIDRGCGGSAHVLDISEHPRLDAKLDSTCYDLGRNYKPTPMPGRVRREVGRKGEEGRVKACIRTQGLIIVLGLWVTLQGSALCHVPVVPCLLSCIPPWSPSQTPRACTRTPPQAPCGLGVTSHLVSSSNSSAQACPQLRFPIRIALQFGSSALPLHIHFMSTPWARAPPLEKVEKE